MGHLTAAQRKKLKSSDFGLPETRMYPIENEPHARSALSYSSRFATPAQQREIRARVHSKYPNMNCRVCGMASKHSHGGNMCCGKPLHCAQILGAEQQSSMPAFGPTPMDYLRGAP